MPQMAPIWWLTMSTLCIITFMLMWTIMYYQYIPTTTVKKFSKDIKEMNWKW
uniref:ATP synthase complex subunit 8 n=1 Tax=Polididus armatissimus TaxID=1524522 RepID=A0A9E9BLS5_9HEMI|nr:ATP synthase F0 subunit 8 [Polididus armatissimus]WAJ48471.1 ATP synthase F0 subunit 8 [Polididus armatissimus]